MPHAGRRRDDCRAAVRLLEVLVSASTEMAKLIEQLAARESAQANEQVTLWRWQQDLAALAEQVEQWLALHCNRLDHSRRLQDKSGIAPDSRDAVPVIRECCMAIPGFSAQDLPGG